MGKGRLGVRGVACWVAGVIRQGGQAVKEVDDFGVVGRRPAQVLDRGGGGYLEEVVTLAEKGRNKMWWEGIGERRDVPEDELDRVGGEGEHGG